MKGEAVLSKLGKKSLAILSAAALVVVVSVIAATWDIWVVAVAGIGVLQLAVLGLLLTQRRTGANVASASVKGLDALSARIMAAVETERLDAIDRHRELMEALKGDISAAR